MLALIECLFGCRHCALHMLYHLILKTIQYYVYFFIKKVKDAIPEINAQYHIGSKVPSINYFHHSIYRS